MKNTMKQGILWLKRRTKNIISNVNESPILILGNQKSGTTVIAVLIAEFGNLTKSIDFGDFVYETSHKLIKVGKGEIPPQKFIKQYRSEFSKQLIKNPYLTFFYDKFSPYFPEAQYLFIARDPRDNIRSILNRVSLPGDKEEINLHEYQNILPEWKQILINDGLKLKGGSYIERLAFRWCAAIDVYLRNQEDMIFISYEAFDKQKERVISDLCQRLSIPQQKNISEKVDIQYQPKGDRSISWEEFFGYRNLKIIETICAERMHKLGYECKYPSK